MESCTPDIAAGFKTNTSVLGDLKRLRSGLQTVEDSMLVGKLRTLCRLESRRQRGVKKPTKKDKKEAAAQKEKERQDPERKCW